MSEKLIVRTCHGDGTQELVEWDDAELRIVNYFTDSELTLRQLAMGYPVRCPFATYQHRDFVAGFEREPKHQGE